VLLARTATCYARSARGNSQPRAGPSASSNTHTGTLITTGLKTEWILLKSLPRVPIPVHCPACGQMHKWVPQDASIDPTRLARFATHQGRSRAASTRDAEKQAVRGRARQFEYISQRRTPSGDAINLCGSVAAPPHCACDRMIGANAGVATSPAVRDLLSDSILRRAKSPVNFKPVDNSCKLQPSLHRVAQIVVLQFISAMHRGGIRCRRHRADIES